MSSSRRSPRDMYAEQVAASMGPRPVRTTGPKRIKDWPTTILLCIVGLMSLATGATVFFSSH